MKIFPILNLKCPNCGGTDRASDMALQFIEAEKGIKKAGDFTSLEQKTIPAVSPARVARPTVPVIVSHFDVCCGCGTYWCTKVEIKDAPFKMVQVPGGPPKSQN